MKIGRKIYFFLATGSVIVDTGDRQYDVIETTEDQDFVEFPQLKGIDKSTVGSLQLNYGDYSTEYQTGCITHVDPKTLTPTFTPYQQ